MDVDNERLGVSLVGIGLVLLLTLRLWASPVAMVVTDRHQVSVVAFLGVPLLLLVMGAGVVVFLWGEELGL